MGFDCIIKVLSDLIDKHQHVVAEERRLEGTHLIQDTAQGPDVRLLSVREVLYDLRAVSKQNSSVNNGTAQKMSGKEYLTVRIAVQSQDCQTKAIKITIHQFNLTVKLQVFEEIPNDL